MADEAIPAATLILVRDSTDGAAELLMVERAEGMAFAAGALVFPGGRIDAADRDLADSSRRTRTLSPPFERPSKKRLCPWGSRLFPIRQLRTCCSKSWLRIIRSRQRCPP